MLNILERTLSLTNLRINRPEDFRKAQLMFRSGINVIWQQKLIFPNPIYRALCFLHNKDIVVYDVGQYVYQGEVKNL